MTHIFVSYQGRTFQLDSINLLEDVDFTSPTNGVVSFGYFNTTRDKDAIQRVMSFIFTAINQTKHNGVAFSIEQVLAILNAGNKKLVNPIPEYNDLRPEMEQQEGIYAMVSGESIIFIPRNQTYENLSRGVLVLNSGSLNYLHTNTMTIDYINGVYHSGQRIIDIRTAKVDFDFPD